jgi:hypothetical protein
MTLLSILSVIVVAAPILVTTATLGLHAWRGTDPGPAAEHLLQLVRLLLGRAPQK